MIKAVELDPRSAMALTSLGTLRFKQKKYIEAKAHLEKAISIDENNYLVNFQYAKLLSRENANQLELVKGYEPERAEKIRKHLRIAIRSEPAFTPSYELLALVNLVNREFLDEALKNLMTAVRYQPRNQRYRLRLAEVLIAQNRFDDARKVAESISKNADSNAIKQHADDLLDRILEKDKAKTVKAN